MALQREYWLSASVRNRGTLTKITCDQSRCLTRYSSRTWSRVNKWENICTNLGSTGPPIPGTVVSPNTDVMWTSLLMDTGRPNGLLWTGVPECPNGLLIRRSSDARTGRCPPQNSQFGQHLPGERCLKNIFGTFKVQNINASNAERGWVQLRPTPNAKQHSRHISFGRRAAVAEPRSTMLLLVC